MGIKIIEKANMNIKHGGSKYNLLAADIREIIQNRIEYCEFENFPYSEKTSVSDIKRRMIPVFADEFKKETGFFPDGYKRCWFDSRWDPPFVMSRTKDENGVHVYGTFYVKTWEKSIEDVKNKKFCVSTAL